MCRTGSRAGVATRRKSMDSSRIDDGLVFRLVDVTGVCALSAA
jgi:hypothetical protein